MHTKTSVRKMSVGQQAAPPVGMGMPVFNGGQFLESALKSLLAQTFDDFELVISDNASTDETESICRDFAAVDKRIRYSRNSTNLGLAKNQNSVIRDSRGKYFLLVHHDDLRAPTYLERTIQVLEDRPELTVCYTITQDIDEHGNPIQRVDPPLRFDSSSVRDRFSDVIRMDHICEPDFGLMRRSSLMSTGLHGDYADSDRVLLAELLFQGPFHLLKEPLFFRRSHPGQSTKIAPNRGARTVWYNPELHGKLVFPHFRQLREFWEAVGRAPISQADRIWCRRRLLSWCVSNRARLLSDLEMAGRQTLRPLKHRLFGKGSR
jgi:glycosyltransferase involved in cell wall biosynthesis